LLSVLYDELFHPYQTVITALDNEAFRKDGLQLIMA